MLRLEVVEETHRPSVGAGRRRAGSRCGPRHPEHAHVRAVVHGAGSRRESHGPLARRRRPPRRPAPDAAARPLAARARRGRLRPDPQPRPDRGLGLRQHRGRGRDGRRAGRLVRGDRAVPAPARAAGAAHGDHPQAQERDRPQPPGVRHRELPHRGDRPRAARRGPRGGAGRAVARGAGAPAAGAHRGRAGRAAPGWAGCPTTRCARWSRTSSCRGSCRSRWRRSPGRCSRGSSTSRPTTAWSTSAWSSCATGSPTTPARTPRAGRAGAVVVAAVGRRQGDRLDLPAGARVAARHPATTRGTRPGRRSTTCSSGSPPTSSTTPRSWRSAESLKERLLTHPQVPETAVGLWKSFRTLAHDGDGRRDLVLPHPRRRAARAPRAAPRRGRGVARAARGAARRGGVVLRQHLRQRARRGHLGDRRPLGRQGGGRADRAARGPRPAVHPDQRHHRRRAGRARHPRPVPGRRAEPSRRRARRLTETPGHDRRGGAGRNMLVRSMYSG